VLAVLVIFIQAVLFNVFLIRHKAYNMNTYVPAALYAVLMMSVADFTTLSPQLISLIFVLLAFDLTFRHIEGRRKQDWIILQIGFYLGLAFLFYSLNYLLLISTIFGFLFYTNTIFRRYLLLLAGFLMPVLLIWVKYYWFNQQDEFYLNFKYLLYPINDLNLVSLKSLIILFALPSVYMIFAFFKVLQTRAFINYQIRLQNFMVIVMIIGVLMIPMDYYRASHVLIMLVPPFAFFISHYFLLIRRKWISEIMFLVLISLAIFQNYVVSFNLIQQKDLLDVKKLYLEDNNLAITKQNKRILIFGEHEGEYYGNKLATPYLSWLISRDLFNNLNNYPAVINIYEKINKSYPEIIIDKEGIVEKIFDRIPEIKSRYRKTAQGTYLLQ
jgi:hypothetical protein